jgi:hypothetical protein
MAMAEIRCLQSGDLADCMRLKAAAGWNQTEADWRALLADGAGGVFRNRGGGPGGIDGDGGDS